MEAQRIMKNVKEGQILCLAQDVKAYLNTLRNTHVENVSLTDSTKYFTFMNRLLRSIGSFMHAKQISTHEEIENLADAVIFCIGIFKDYYLHSSVIKTVQLECSLYHITVNLLHLKFYSQSILCAEFLRELINLSFDINLDNKDLLIITNNMCISFWNFAMEVEQNEEANFKYYIGLQLRTVAITFLCFHSSEMQNIKSKISKAVMRYCTSKECQPISEHLMKSLNTIWTYILVVHSKYKKELNQKQLLLFEILNTCNACLIFYIQDKAVFDCIFTWLQNIKSINCGSFQENNHILVNICVEVMSFCVKFFTLGKLVIVSQQMVKNWEKIFKLYKGKERTEKAKMITSLCSFISFHLLEGFKVITSQNNLKETFLKNIVASEFLVKLCLDNSYEEETLNTSIKHHSELVLAGGLLNIFLVIAQVTDADTSLQLLTKARTFVEYVSSHQTTGIHKREIARAEDLLYYGMEVGNIGVVCYTKNLYDLAICFLKCSCNYLFTFLERETVVKQHYKESLWKKQELLIHCYKLTACHNKALEIVVKALLMHDEKLKNAIELWVKIKREAQRSSKDSIVLKTIKDVMLECEISINDDHMIMFLQQELRAYKKERNITQKASISVLTQLLELSADDTNKALILLESVQISLTIENGIFSLDQNDRTPMNMCKEAIGIFENSVCQNPDDNSYKLQLSVALFWMYQTKLFDLQQIAKEEVEKSPVTPLEVDTKKRGPRGDEDDKNDQCDIKPAFPHVTSQIELESLEILNRALGLWMEISKSTCNAQWRMLLPTVEALDFLDIIRTTAEVFAAAANDVNELRTWSIMQELAKEAGNQVVELVAFGSMVMLLTRLGYLNMAGLVIDHVENHIVSCSETYNEFHMARLKFYIAKSDYLLQTEKYICGFQLLLTVLNDPLLERNTKSSIMLAAEAKLLASYYCLLPPAAFENSPTPFQVFHNETPITLALDSLKKSLSLIRYQKPTSEGYKSVIDRDSPWCKPMMVRILLNSTLMVGKLYTDIGAPREARCYLQECLSVAQQFILTYWSGKILISLANLDLICDNLDDCQVKLAGLQYMLCIEHRSPTLIFEFDKKAKQNLTTNEDEQNEEENFLATRSGLPLKGYIRQKLIDKKQNLHSSPLTQYQKKVTYPSILKHPESCSCQLCEFHSLNHIHLDITFLQCQYLANTGYYKEAADELKQLLKAHDILSRKLKAENIFCLIKVNSHYPDRAFQRVLHKVDTMFLFQVTMQLAIVNTNQCNYQMALFHLYSAMDYLKGASKCPEYHYSQLYGSLVYQKVVIFIKKMVSSKEFHDSQIYGDMWLKSQTPLASSAVPKLSENLGKLNINSETPKSKRCIPDISVSSFTNPGTSTKLCKAPVKREIFSSLMKNCINALPATPDESKRSSGAQSSLYIFSSSDDDNAFLSPHTSIDFSPQKAVAEQKKLHKLSESVKNIKTASKLKAKNGSATKTFLKESVSGVNYNVCEQSNDQSIKEIQHSTSKSKHLSVSNHVLPIPTSKDTVLSRVKSTDPENISKCLSSVNLNKENMNLIYQQAKRQLHNCKSAKQTIDTNENQFVPVHNAPRRSRRVKKVMSDINCIETERKGDDNDIFLCSPVASISIQDNERQLLPNSYQPPVESLEQRISLLKLCSPPEILRGWNNNSKQKPEHRSLNGKIITTHRYNIKSNRQRQTFKSTSEKDEAQNSIIRSSISELLPTSVLAELNQCSGSSDVKAMILDDSNFPEINLEDLVSELKYAVSLIQHHPPCPLYANMSLMLAVLSSHKVKKLKTEENEQKLHAAFFMSESVAVTLRHQAVICLSKIIRKFDGSDVSSLSNEMSSNIAEEPNLLTVSVVKKQALCFKNQETDSAIVKRMKELKNILPEAWTVVQVCAVPSSLSVSMSKHKLSTPELIVCQYRKASSPNMAFINQIDPEFNTNFLSEFEAILQESSSTMTNKDAKIWWTLRRSLDARMKGLSESMENSWLGCWKGLFLGLPSCQERIYQLKEAVAKVQVEAKQLGCSVADAGMIQVLLDSLKLLTAEQLFTAVSHLWKVSVEDPAHSTLCKYVQSIASSFVDCNRFPVILILGKDIQALPWESMPTLRNNTVTRVPSLILLHAQLIHLQQPKSVLSEGIDSQQTFYILNPGCDISYTQEKFEAIFKQQKCWKGIVGRTPTSEEFISAFTDYKLFLYCGHGTGRIYIEGQSIEKLHCQAATILMGCSSGRLKFLGHKLEPFGVVLQYWLGGSPCIVANLWDVTDKDIDRFTNTFLERWVPQFGVPSETGINIGQAVAIARNACKLPFLIGAAPVIYGLPVFISK